MEMEKVGLDSRRSQPLRLETHEHIVSAKGEFWVTSDENDADQKSRSGLDCSACIRSGVKELLVKTKEMVLLHVV
jgi:hypothetical protein